MSRKSITAVLEAADATGVVWIDMADSTDRREVDARLFPARGEHQSVFAQPDWDQVHREMTRVGVTPKLLQGEYAVLCGLSTKARTQTIWERSRSQPNLQQPPPDRRRHPGHRSLMQSYFVLVTFSAAHVKIG